MSIEELAKKFVILAAKPALTKAEHEEALKLMQELKGEGMNNTDISELSKGKWTPSTVKFYTPGIKPAHPNPWDNAVASLDKLLSASLTLDDVETAMTVAEDLDSHSTSLGQVIELLVAAESSSIEIADLFHQQEQLKQFGDRKSVV